VNVGRESHRGLVLMGFAEAMAAIEAAWSLQRAGFQVAAFQRAGSKPALRRVAGVELHAVPAPELDAEGTVLAVRGLIEDLAPSVLLPLDDPAVWVCSRLADAGVGIAGPLGAAAECALNKSAQLNAARRAGLRVPATQALRDLRRTGGADSPVMIKPARAIYERDGKLVRPIGIVSADAEEFRRAAARPWPEDTLVQPLIRGVGEGLFGHMGEGGVIAWSAHRRVRMVNPQGSASSACRSQPVDPELIEPSERFLDEIGWRGMFMLEFLRDADGVPWFMELNGRAWGSMALARRRGLEYPAWSVEAAIDSGFEPTPPPPSPDIVCRNLGLELVHVLFVLRGPQSAAQTEWPGRATTMRDVLRFRRTDRWYNWCRSQPQVLLADTLGTVHGQLLRLQRRRS
jgi:predicted ATP-grasp superfamily ATP-dependent carboligase